MDLFAWSNTLQTSARVSVVPWAEGRLFAEYRYVRFVENGTWLDSYLGVVTAPVHGDESAHEVDGWASWRPWPVLDLVAGYSLLLLSDEAKQLLWTRTVGPEFTASLAHFAYLQATLRVP